MASLPAVEASGLTRVWGSRTALCDVSLAVAPGEIFALLGPNGGGKTTLFRILATLLPATSGHFAVCGFDPSRHLKALRARLGVVFQSPSLDRKLTVRENVLLQGKLYGLSGARLASRADELLSRFGVADRSGDLVETLSGGLARRVEIAKALLHEPPVLLLDEPSTGLDPLVRRDLLELLLNLVRGGTAVLLTTHLFEEAEAAHRIGILDGGRLVALGPPAELKRSVGGDVLSLETSSDDEASRLLSQITASFGAEAGRAAAVGATVRLERPRGHELLPRLVEAFPGRFRSATLGAPSLKDVFIDRTGHPFGDPEGGAEGRT